MNSKNIVYRKVKQVYVRLYDDDGQNIVLYTPVFLIPVLRQICECTGCKLDRVK